MTVHSVSTPCGDQDERLQIVVVGRGFSGMMTAIALLKTVTRPFHLRLFDPHSTISGGQALASAHSTEILNSRVRDLSVSGQPDDFTDWLTDNHAFRQTVPAAIPGFGQIFVQKAIFSDYVYQRFSEALAERRDVTVQMLNDIATRVRKSLNDGFFVDLESGGAVHCDVAFLATGYGAQPQAAEVKHDPDDATIRDQLAGFRHVVVLGNGLRAVDRVLQLRDAGFAGDITILSRRGFLPQPHTRLSADPVFPAQAMPKKLPAILRYVREVCAQAEADGRGWQAAMNGLRKRARSLWTALPQNEKRQFNRHLRAIYDSHRNRLPPDMHGRLERELAGGMTTMKRGRALKRTADGLIVRWRGKAAEDFLPADAVVDCRCLSPDLADPLIAGLLQSGLAMKDELELGLAVKGTGEVQMPKGGPGGLLFAVGPLGLGSLPDIDLVPEIVTQAYTAAALVATAGTAHRPPGQRPAANTPACISQVPV
jgi:uncharacterized NAD(P)/FAD-binding protein YdhS